MKNNLKLYSSLVQMQKNSNILLGQNNDVSFILNIEAYSKWIGQNNFELENDINYFNTNIPVQYRSSTFIRFLKNIDNFLILGSFPRFEASIVNLHIRQSYNKHNQNIVNIGPWNNHTYPVSNVGTSVKTLYSLLTGNNLVIKNFINKQKFSVITSLNKYTHNGDSNQQFLNQILANKFFLYMNKENQLINLSSNNTATAAFEFSNLLNSRSPIHYKKTFDKNFVFNNIFGLNIKESKEKTKELIVFNTHNISSKKNKVGIFLPILSFFEKSCFLLNIEGKIQHSPKVATSASNSVKDLSNIVESLYYLQNENKKLFNSETEIYLDKNKKRLNNSSKNSYLLLNSFLKKQSILNLIKVKKNRYLHSFSLFYNLTKFYNKNMKLGHYKNNVNNFYKTDLITENSYTMSLSTFFNLNNEFLPKSF